MARSQVSKASRIDAHLRGVRGHLRSQHYAEGGTPAEWRGRSSVQPDKRREGSRRRCRVPHQEVE